MTNRKVIGLITILVLQSLIPKIGPSILKSPSFGPLIRL